MLLDIYRANATWWDIIQHTMIRLEALIHGNTQKHWSISVNIFMYDRTVRIQWQFRVIYTLLLRAAFVKSALLLN